MVCLPRKLMNDELKKKVGEFLGGHKKGNGGITCSAYIHVRKLSPSLEQRGCVVHSKPMGLSKKKTKPGAPSGGHEQTRDFVIRRQGGKTVL